MNLPVRPDLVAFATHLAVALLFSGIFAFLYVESRHIYFKYWTIAWTLLWAALLLRMGWLNSGQTVFLVAAGLLRLAFATSLIFAAAAVSGSFEGRLTWLALLAPMVGALVYATGATVALRGADTLHGLLLMAIYVLSFVRSRRLPFGAFRSGHKIFSIALLAGSLLALHDTLVQVASFVAPGALPVSSRYGDLYHLVFETLLAFSAMMMWMETQHEQLRLANEQLDENRRQLALNAQTDALTGLLNRSALNEFCDANQPVPGLVAVLDLDNFKAINDTHGHVVGDEVLASVGNLIRASVRKTDRAWRWGGDEFVILFQDQGEAVVAERLQALEERLQQFQIRGRGALPIRLRWGLSEIEGGPLRQAIERADHRMYLKKKEKSISEKISGD